MCVCDRIYDFYSHPITNACMWVLSAVHCLVWPALEPASWRSLATADRSLVMVLTCVCTLVTSLVTYPRCNIGACVCVQGLFVGELLVLFVFCVDSLLRTLHVTITWDHRGGRFTFGIPQKRAIDWWRVVVSCTLAVRLDHG